MNHSVTKYNSKAKCEDKVSIGEKSTNKMRINTIRIIKGEKITFPK